MLDITITTDDRLVKFQWGAHAEEFNTLWDEFGALADRRGQDPVALATAAIHRAAADGLPEDEIAARGQAAWIVYAVLHHMAGNKDVGHIADEAGLTVFDLAENQHVTANVAVDEDGHCTMELVGRSQLDS